MHLLFSGTMHVGTVLYSPRLFVVGGEHIAMVMLVYTHIQCSRIAVLHGVYKKATTHFIASAHI